MMWRKAVPGVARRPCGYPTLESFVWFLSVYQTFSVKNDEEGEENGSVQFDLQGRGKECG